MNWLQEAVRICYQRFVCRKCGKIRPICEEVLNTGICALCDDLRQERRDYGK